MPGNWFQRHWDDYLIQVSRIAGDMANTIFTAACFYHTPTLTNIPGVQALFTLALLAEIVRLVTEKGAMILSASWQALPHRRIASRLAKTPVAGVLQSYCAYYSMEDDERLAQVLLKLKTFAASDQKTAEKVSYVRGFRIVPETVGLRCGRVRDIARGEIYVHASWTNQPDLLYGLSLRRSPWIFDPRYLQRPFYYRTQANRLMTMLVFENAALCPLFAIYQFGHEVKSARYDAVFRLLNRIGIRVEQAVEEDGTFPFEPLAVFLKVIHPEKLQRTLWTDDEVLHSLGDQPYSSLPTALEIAIRYSYPLVYVENILLPKIQSYVEKTSLTT